MTFLFNPSIVHISAHKFRLLTPESGPHHAPGLRAILALTDHSHGALPPLHLSHTELKDAVKRDRVRSKAKPGELQQSSIL